MINFIIIDSFTGEIKRTGTAPQSGISSQAYKENEIAIAVEEKVNSNFKYYDIDNEEIVDRPPSSSSINTTSIEAYDIGIALLTGVTSGTKLYVNYKEYTSDGTDIELSFYEPGEYEIRVMEFPEQVYLSTIHAN